MCGPTFRLIPTIVAAAFLLLFFGAGAALAQAGQGAYAGDSVCLECHEEAKESIASTSHGKSGFDQLSSRGCEACHGPAKAHSEDPGDESLLPTLLNLTPTSSRHAAKPATRGRRSSSGITAPIASAACRASRAIRCTTSSPRPGSSRRTPRRSSATSATRTSAPTPGSARTTRSARVRSSAPTATTRTARKRRPSSSTRRSTSSATAVTPRSAARSCGITLRCARDCTHLSHAPHGSNHLKLQRTSVALHLSAVPLQHPAPRARSTTATTQRRRRATVSNRDFSRACT